MSNFELTCCSTSDLSHEYFKERNIGVIYFHFELGGTDYADDMGTTVPPKELFKRMLEGEDTKTSQVTVGEYTEFFEPMLKEEADLRSAIRWFQQDSGERVTRNTDRKSLKALIFEAKSFVSKRSKCLIT